MKTSAKMALEIVEAKNLHPTWGPSKIASVAAKHHPAEPTPSVVTTGRVLRSVA